MALRGPRRECTQYIESDTLTPEVLLWGKEETCKYWSQSFPWGLPSLSKLQFLGSQVRKTLVNRKDMEAWFWV